MIFNRNSRERTLRHKLFEEMIIWSAGLNYEVLSVKWPRSWKSACVVDQINFYFAARSVIWSVVVQESPRAHSAWTESTEKRCSSGPRVGCFWRLVTRSIITHHFLRSCESLIWSIFNKNFTSFNLYICTLLRDDNINPLIFNSCLEF